MIWVRLNGNSLRAKFGIPKSRWHGKYSDINAVVKAAWDAGMPSTFKINYVTQED